MRLLPLLLLLLSAAAFAQSVGVSPSIIREEASPGDTKAMRFFLVTPQETPLVVHVEPSPGSIEFFSNSYAALAANYSEEDAVPWVNFPVNPVELRPGNETLKTLAGEVKGWHDISFIVSVPEDAEPGYHLVLLNPSPSVVAGPGAPVGTNIVAVVAIPMLLNIKGNALRQGTILDVVPLSFDGENLRMVTYFRNTGTVTVTARASQDVFDEELKPVTRLVSSKMLVGPGKTAEFMTEMPAGAGGTFFVATTVDYLTGSAYKNTSVEVPAAVTAAAAEGPAEFPWIIIVVLIIIISAYIYYRR